MVQHSRLEGSPQPIFRRSIVIGAILATLFVAGSGIYTLQTGQNTSKKEQPIVIPEVKTVTALGRLEPQGEVIQLSAPTSAEGNRVEKLLVKEGSKVKEGQIIAILDNRDRLTAALAEAQEAVRVAQANLALVKAGAKQGEIEAQKATIARLEAEQNTEMAAQKATIARLEAEQNTEMAAQKATIARLEAELDNAEAEYNRYQKLYQQGAISISSRDSRFLTLATARQQVVEAKANLQRIEASREQQLAEAQANLRRIETSREQQIKEGRATLNRIAEVRPVEVAAAQAEVNRNLAAVRRAEANLKQAFVRAPQEGQVIKIHTRPGELVSSEGIAEIGKTNLMYAVLEVYQSDVSKIQMGQQVRLASESIPGELQGTIERIGLLVERQDIINSDPSTNIDSRVVEVHVQLDRVSSEKAAGFTNLQVKGVIDL